MLVLTRKENERIMIGEGVELVVLAVQGQRVKLGIQAAPDVRIERIETKGSPQRRIPVGCFAT